MAHALVIDLPGGTDFDILRALKERGDTFCFLSNDLEYYQRQEGIMPWLEQAEELIQVKPFDDSEVEKRVIESHRRKPFTALLCLLDTRLVAAARLAAKLGLPYLNPESAQLLRDKYSVRKRLQEKGLPQPEFALATTNAEVKAAVEKLGLPVLIKPSDGYGSQNIVVLRYPEDLDPLLSPVDELLPSRADYGLGVKANDRLLVERFLEGTFLGCDTLTENGNHRLLGIHEKLFYDQPSFAIRGGCFMPNHPGFREIEKYLFALLDAAGFDWGATHTELMLTREGPRLIEINPRLVGAKIPRLIGDALGRSVHADLIALHAGQGLPPEPGPIERIAVTRWLAAPQSGILERIEVPDRMDDRICRVEIMKKTGDAVQPPMENADRLGYVMVAAGQRREAEEIADRFISDCRITVRPARNFSTPC